MMKILYVIPFSKIGGAETAFNSVVNLHGGNIEIVKVDLNLSSNNPIFYIKAFLNLFRLIEENNIKIVVTSLWKSHLVVYLLSLIFKFQIVPFIHAIKFFNIFDKIISVIVIKKAKYLLVDSKNGELFIKKYNSSSKIFTFLIHTPLKIVRPNFILNEKPSFSFLFVGRLSKVKRLDKALEFLNIIYLNLDRNVIFDIYGPLEDGFNLNCYLNKYKYLNINYKGILYNNDRANIYHNYNFYLQLSDSEGSGMSIIEAMRYGLIPVITNVGEVVKSCESGKNSIIFGTGKSPNEMFEYFKDILDLITINQLSNNAFDTFRNVVLFNDVLLEILNEIFFTENA